MSGSRNFGHENDRTMTEINPDETLRELIEAIDAGDGETGYHATINLISWINKGGSKPRALAPILPIVRGAASLPSTDTDHDPLVSACEKERARRLLEGLNGSDRAKGPPHV